VYFIDPHLRLIQNNATLFLHFSGERIRDGFISAPMEWNGKNRGEWNAEPFVGEEDPMKTKIIIPAAWVALAMILVSCGAVTTSVSTPTPIPPTQTPTPLPDITVTPVPPSGGTSSTPPAATDTPAPGGTGTVNITILNFAFDPPSVTVKVGTTVQWTNQDSATHSITSDKGLWDSGGVGQGKSYTRVFDTVGTFGYYCGIHPTMKGTIIVAT
jgi:plastocyanin